MKISHDEHNVSDDVRLLAYCLDLAGEKIAGAGSLGALNLADNVKSLFKALSGKDASGILLKNQDDKTHLMVAFTRAGARAAAISSDWNDFGLDTLEHANKFFKDLAKQGVVGPAVAAPAACTECRIKAGLAPQG